MISIEHLSKSFGKKSVLRDISLELNPGNISAILGPNGSGKTTLIKSILGMVIPEQEDISVQGELIKGKHLYRDNIDYLPQIARFPENLKVRELFRMIQDLRKRKAQPEPLIQRFELEPFLDTRLGHLSGGTRQKVNLVQAFMYDSPIIILDEPTSGLDPVATIRLKELILKEREKGKLILITSHIMDFVEEMAEDIIFLLDGHIHFKGSCFELKEKYHAAKLETAIAKMMMQTDVAPVGTHHDVSLQAQDRP